MEKLRLWLTKDNNRLLFVGLPFAISVIIKLLVMFEIVEKKTVVWFYVISISIFMINCIIMLFTDFKTDRLKAEELENQS